VIVSYDLFDFRKREPDGAGRGGSGSWPFVAITLMMLRHWASTIRVLRRRENTFDCFQHRRCDNGSRVSNTWNNLDPNIGLHGFEK